MLNTSSFTPKLTTGFLNTQDDPAPGLLTLGTTPTSGQVLGQLGQVLTLNHDEANRLSKTSVGTLWGGRYQYVKFLTATVKGGIVYWDDVARAATSTPNAYVVTATAPSAGARFAGVALAVQTAGNYGWIQIDGLATVLFKASITKTTPAIDDLVVVTITSNAGEADVLADATGLTSVNGKTIIGVAYETPTGGGLKRIYLFQRILNP